MCRTSQQAQCICTGAIQPILQYIRTLLSIHPLHALPYASNPLQVFLSPLAMSGCSTHSPNSRCITVNATTLTPRRSLPFFSKPSRIPVCSRRQRGTHACWSCLPAASFSPSFPALYWCNARVRPNGLLMHRESARGARCISLGRPAAAAAVARSAAGATCPGAPPAAPAACSAACGCQWQPVACGGDW